MADEINKLYAGITDAQMLEEAQVKLDLFGSFRDDFTAFDASLNSTFGDDLQDKITAAQVFKTDETVVDEISELTDKMLDAWNNCKKHFQDAKYFIEKAFPGNKKRHDVFGFDDYERMSRNQTVVVQFMNQFGAAATQYKTELIAAGYSQEKIDAITSLSSDFDKANRAQEMAKKVRGEITQNRTIAMNAVWSGIKTINLASKSVYRNNYARLQMFLMPAPASNEAPEALSLTGTIINTVTNLPEADVAVSLPDLDLTTTTDLSGRFAFAAGTPAGTTRISAVKTGFANFESTVVLVADTLVVKNFQITPV